MARDPGPARGLLHVPVAGDAAHRHRRIAPPSWLAPWVQHFWSVTWDRRGLPPWRASNLPHPNVHLVVGAGASAIHGVQSGRFEVVLEGRGRVFGIKFRPGGFQPFLGAPVSDLRDRRVGIETVFPLSAAAFEAAVLATCDDDACIELAGALLAAHLPATHDPDVELAGRIVDAIAEDRELVSVATVLQRHGLRLRALQRLFQRHVGATPKWVINRYRLHEAVEQVRAGRHVAWAALAAQLGYYDQAHFNRDFRRLVGRTPAQFERDLAAAAAMAQQAGTDR